LLDALTSGIVAVDMAGRVTVINQIAQKITDMPASTIVGMQVSLLPAVLADAVAQVFADQQAFQDRDVMMERGEQRVPIRLSGSPFHSHTGQQLGVLLVFSDMTAFREMEEQVRRSDRLSSIGTLSAGMAHEIKNPLVTIKTFTQLLPEKHENEKFRQTFFELVGQEVKRIDTLVNRLLRFARPVKGNLRPASLHAAVEDALHLVAQQLERKDIALCKELTARDQQILADTEQLNQAFVNLLLNAIDAMPDGGKLTVRTRNGVFPLDVNGNGLTRQKRCVELAIQDTGSGITESDMNRIFDPFFTTKDHGVGLGLSVTHGIIQEHHATVHVESQPEEGATFVLRFPLLDQDHSSEEGP